MKKFRLSDTRDHISQEGLRNGSRLAPAKSVFLVVRGMILAKALPVALAEVPMAFNQDMKALVARPAADPEYLLYALAARKDALATAISTSAHGTRRMETASLESLLLPLPPKDEQRRVAGVLDRLQRAVSIQERIVATLRELKAATIAKVFREGLRAEPFKQTDIGPIPKGWTVRDFSEFATLQRGYDLPVQHRRSGSVPVIGSNGMVGHHDKAAAKGPGVTTGRSGSIGLTFFSEVDFWPLNTSLYVVDFHGNDPFFVHCAFQQFDFLRYAAGVSVPTLNRNLVHKATFAIPPLSEQLEIASTLRALDQTIAAARSKLAGLEYLFSSMLALLMTGQVRVPPDLIDRPAPARLEGKPAPEVIDEIVRRIVETVAPDKIVLFGSAVPGSPSAKRGVGVLVVMPFQGRSLAKAIEIERDIGPQIPLEILVRRPEDVSRALQSGDPFIKGIVERGRLMHASAVVRAPEPPSPRPVRRGAVSEEVLGEIVQRIVEVAAPRKIVLFGSAARAEMGPDSDIDLLVVTETDQPRETACRIRQCLIGVPPGVPKDVIVVTPEHLERHKDTIGFIFRPALREGRVLYVA